MPLSSKYMIIGGVGALLAVALIFWLRASPSRDGGIRGLEKLLAIVLGVSVLAATVAVFIYASKRSMSGLNSTIEASNDAMKALARATGLALVEPPPSARPIEGAALSYSSIRGRYRGTEVEVAVSSIYTDEISTVFRVPKFPVEAGTILRNAIGGVVKAPRGRAPAASDATPLARTLASGLGQRLSFDARAILIDEDELTLVVKVKRSFWDGWESSVTYNTEVDPDRLLRILEDVCELSSLARGLSDSQLGAIKARD